MINQPVQVGDMIETHQSHAEWDEKLRDEKVLYPGTYQVQRVIYHVCVREFPVRLEEGEYTVVEKGDPSQYITVKLSDLQDVMSIASEADVYIDPRLDAYDRIEQLLENPNGLG